MTAAALGLVSLVSAWSHKRPLFPCDSAGETNEPCKTKFFAGPEAVEKIDLAPAIGSENAFPLLKGIAWSHWSCGLTPITKGVFRRQRDQPRPKQPLLRPKPAAGGAR